MNIGYLRDLIALLGLAAIVAGTWIIAGLGVALIVLGVVFLSAGLSATVRGGDA